MGDFGGSGAGLFGMHRDVLDAVPSDDASKARLVDELKARGNAAFKAGDFEAALRSYAEAIAAVDSVTHAAVTGARCCDMCTSSCGSTLEPSWGGKAEVVARAAAPGLAHSPHACARTHA